MSARASPNQSQSKFWCFTKNNYSDDDVELLSRLAESDHVTYLVFGREVGEENGTPHLQGYIEFKQRRRFNQARALLPNGSHIETRLGSAKEAADYCKKDGDYFESGELSVSVQGKRNDLDEPIEWIKGFVHDNNRVPSSKELATAFPIAYVRYSERLLNYATAICPNAKLLEGDYRDWQIPLAEKLNNPPDDDRTIDFFVDPLGGSGKTWFAKKYYSENENCQLLSVGKVTDVSYLVDESKSVFIFMVPKSGMEFFPYRIAEQLKDRVVFSTKYQGRTKTLPHNPHVLVFSNEMPDVSKLTPDRINVIELSVLPAMGIIP